MGSLKRKMRRRRAQKMSKEFTKALKQQLDMVGSMPDECLACKKPFDRKSKEHADTWKVVVRKQSQETNLYCPTCWDTAMKMIKEMEDQNDN